MSKILVALVFLCMVSAVVFAVVFLVKWITRRPKKQVGLVAVFCVVGALAFAIIGSQIWLNNMTPAERAAYDAEVAQQDDQSETERAEGELRETAEQEEKDGTDRITNSKETAAQITPATSLERTEPPPTPEPTEPPYTAEQVESIVGMGYSQSEAEEIATVLASIGVGDVELIYADEEQADGSRMVACLPDGYNGTRCQMYFLTVNGECTYAAVNNIGGSGDVYVSDKYTLYDTEQGGVLAQYEDTVKGLDVTDAEEMGLMDMMEGMAQQLAQNPKSVRFRTMYWGFEKFYSGSEYVFWAQGTFECSNLMGYTEECLLTAKFITYNEGQGCRAVKVWLDGKLIADEE